MGNGQGALRNDGQPFPAEENQLVQRKGGEEFQHQTISVRICEVKENGDKTRKELGHSRSQRQTETGF